MDQNTATEQAYKNGYEQGQFDAVKMLTKGLIDFIQNGTFRKGYELKKVERKVKEIAKKYGVKIDDGE